MTAEAFQNLFLTGFMGAGKSTVGRLLAELLGCPFIDLDDVIVAREQRAIADIFATDGEPYFRTCETEALQSLDPQITAVYATGGGIVTRAENRDLMRRLGQILYLDASWPTLKQRLQHSVDRPLISQGRDWAEVERLWQQRQPCYLDADMIIATGGLSPQQVAQTIFKRMTPGRST